MHKMELANELLGNEALKKNNSPSTYAPKLPLLSEAQHVYIYVYYSLGVGPKGPTLARLPWHLKNKGGDPGIWSGLILSKV